MDELDELDALMIGQVLVDGWTVVSPRFIQRDAASDFRTYIASNADGEEAFVKLLDPRANGPLDAAERKLALFNYEKNLVEICGGRKLRRVIRGLAYGTVSTPPPFSLTLHYLIFEWAECDLRSRIELNDGSHLAVVLRWMHHTATALQELHYSEIAHQDVKPANVLIMADRSAKLGDLGRAYRHTAPRTTETEGRDETYSAPELLYTVMPLSFDDRCAADMYAFGSLMFFLVTGMSLNAELARELASMHHWSTWRGSFQDALIFVRRAHEDIMTRAAATLTHEEAPRLVTALRQLTDPDPAHRGHPLNRTHGGSRYGFERYVSLLDLLARYAERDRTRVA